MSKKLSRQQRRGLDRTYANQLPSSQTEGTGAQQQWNLHASMVQVSQVSWPSYLPPPEVLQRYGFIKNGPERFLRMVERQQKHRHKIENRSSWTEAFQRVVGSIGGVVIGLSGLAVGGGLIYTDHGLAGFAAFFSALTVLVAAVQSTRDARKSGSTQAAVDNPPQLQLPLDDNSYQASGLPQE